MFDNMRNGTFNCCMDIFQKINDVFGSQSALARILKIEPMTVSQWKSRGRIPAERCPDIAGASNGQIHLHELRPDIYPDPTKAACQKRRKRQKQGGQLARINGAIEFADSEGGGLI